MDFLGKWHEIFLEVNKIKQWNFYMIVIYVNLNLILTSYSRNLLSQLKLIFIFKKLDSPCYKIIPIFYKKIVWIFVSNKFFWKNKINIHIKIIIIIDYQNLEYV
jgi:hypothetical protein